MLNSYISASQTIPSGGVINFNIDKIKTGCATKHAAGSTTFNLTREGYYLVSFSASASATVPQTAPIITQLFLNGTAVPDAISSALSAAASTPITLGFSTIIRVLPSCRAIDNTTNLTLQSTGVEAVYSNASIVITKLC